MMKYFWTIAIAGLMTLNIWASNSIDQIKLTCHLAGCGSELFLFEFDGGTFQEFSSASVKSDSIFVFKLDRTNPKFYYIGVEPSGAVPIIVGSENEVVISASCGVRLSLDFENSPLNSGYVNLKAEMNQLRQDHVKLVQQYRQFRSYPERLENLEKKLGDLDDKKVDFLDSLKIANPYFAKIAALNTYLSFQANGEGYTDEVSYFGEQFFQFVDFEDDVYNQIPWVYEAFRTYTNTLSSIRMREDIHLSMIKGQVNKIPQASRARKLALASIVTTLREKKHNNFTSFAEQFVQEYEDQDPLATADLKRIIKETKAFTIGGEAPNFSQPSPIGESIQLKDFRGKYLLVDFWASWCGPCRKENPNVVRMYNQYKDKGFEILGVSLDRNKDRWLNAIAQDKLTWPQISDLKGWQNEVAQLYGVKSIPHTILLDKEGKILARNLRGRSLEDKLEEIFSSPE